MVGNGTTAHRNLCASYRWITADQFDEEGADLLEYSEDRDSFYLAKDWQEEDHEIYSVCLSKEIIDFLAEMVTFKFGVIDFPEGEWYYFVWSKDRPGMFCGMMREFDGSIQADSRRFWRMTRLMTAGMRRGNGTEN